MKSILILCSFIATPIFAASGGDLDPNDFVGISFWLVTAAMLAENRSVITFTRQRKLIHEGQRDTARSPGNTP